MLAWVLNTPLLFEDFLNVLFRILHYKTFEICYFFKVLYIKHAIKRLIIKPFDLLNTIPLARTKTLVNNLLMNVLMKEQPKT